MIARFRRDEIDAVALDNGTVRITLLAVGAGEIVGLTRGGYDYIYPRRVSGLPARIDVDGDSVVVSGEHGARRVTLDGDVVLLEDEGTVTYPDLVAAPDSSIELPGSVITVDVEWSATQRFSGVVTWPWASANNGDVVDLGHLDGPHLKVAERIWTSKLREGHVRYINPAANAALSFDFDPLTIPHLRVAIDQGGNEHFSVSIEPRCAKTDTAPAPKRHVRLAPCQAMPVA